jgi:hypothetical protein
MRSLNRQLTTAVCALGVSLVTSAAGAQPPHAGTVHPAMPPGH